MDNPLDLLAKWWSEAKQNSPLQQKSAVCISTIDANGFPNSRFVDLKDIDEQGVIFCTSYQSQKAQDISRNPKVSLTAWWDHIGYQVRLQGDAQPIPVELANHYWQQRSHDARIATLGLQQSQPAENFEQITAIVSDAHRKFSESTHSRPENWGGYHIVPSKIEFLLFKENRIHQRRLFESINNHWVATILQP
ncbi:MAG: pyridoxal 5'-phosphate synthase [Aestuariibacter sp.]